MYNILISGYYGFDNIGDESILRTLITSLREKIPDCRLTVLSHNPASTREKYGVEAVERMSPGAILRAVRQCDMLISGGGSLLQHVTSSKSIRYYLFIIRLAKLLGKKVFIYSQGIGPIDHAFNRRATARALKKADGIVVRDERSAKLLEQIGLPQERIVITADPVIRMKRPDRTVGREILARAGIKKDGRLTVGWAIREKNRDSTFVREITECIRWLRENYDAESVLIPFHYEEDREVCSVIAERTNGAAKCLSEKYLSEDMLSIIGNMDVLVGVRLHSMIYAAIMGVPIIGVSYDPKCTAFLDSVGRDSLSTRETFSAEAFKAEFARVLETGKEQTATVAENMRRLQKELDTNEEMIRDIMEGQKKGKAAAGEAASTRTAGAIGLVFILTLVAKLLGVVREMLQANYFGTGIDADLYTASYNSTLYLFTTVCYALCIAAVPILTQEFAAKRERGIRAANNLVTITLLGSLGVVGVWQVLASTPLVGILWDVAESELPRLVGYIRIMSCALPIVAMAYLMVALYQATDHYELQGSMSIPYNVFLAVFLFLFGSKLGIGGIVVASTFAWLLQLGMSLPYAHKENYRYRPALDLRADYIGRYFKTAAVSVLTTSVFLFCTKDDTGSYLSYIWNVTENTLLFIFPVCAMMSAFGTDIIRVIFESGSFTAESTEVTGNIFGMYALGMSAFAVLDLLNKAYYAMKKTLVPLLINLGILVLNLILNSLFDTGSGVALATSAAITVGALVMIAELFRGRKIVRIVPLAKGLAAAGAMAVVLYGGHALLVNGLESKLMLVIKCGALGAAGCVVYVLVSLALKQAIISEFLHKLRKKA